MDRNELLQENINLIRKIAWSFHHSTGLEWDDLFEEACVGFLVAYNRYDPNKSKLSTWAFHTVRNHLIDYCRKWKGTHHIHLSCIEFEPEDPKAEADLFFEDLLRGLSGKGKEVAQTIMEAPNDFFSLPPKMARGKIRDFLREKGWKWQDIWDGMREVDQILSK